MKLHSVNFTSQNFRVDSQSTSGCAGYCSRASTGVAVRGGVFCNLSLLETQPKGVCPFVGNGADRTAADWKISVHTGSTRKVGLVEYPGKNQQLLTRKQENDSVATQ